MRVAGYAASAAEAMREDLARYRALYRGCIQRAVARWRAVRLDDATVRAERYRAWRARTDQGAE